MILLGIVFILLGVRNLNRKKNINFSNSLKDTNDNLSDYDIKLGELRREFSETILELQQEIEQFKGVPNAEIEIIPKQKKVRIDKEELKKESENIKAEDNNNNVKVNEIATLLKRGLTLDEISEKLNISKGELLLIKELYLK
jgi:two-component SAPR family response regulator